MGAPKREGREETLKFVKSLLELYLDKDSLFCYLRARTERLLEMLLDTTYNHISSTSQIKWVVG